MDISFTSNGWEDLEYWIDNDPDTVKRIKDLIKSIRQDPFRGLGKPEPLRYDLKGYWSFIISLGDEGFRIESGCLIQNLMTNLLSKFCPIQNLTTKSD